MYKDCKGTKERSMPVSAYPKDRKTGKMGKTGEFQKGTCGVDTEKQKLSKSRILEIPSKRKGQLSNLFVFAACFTS